MTIRSLINKKKRNFMLVTYGGFIVFIVGMVVRANSKTIPVVALLGFVVALLGFCAAFGAMVYAMFGFRCPRCKEAWGYVALYTGGPFSIAQRFRFCPYYGVDLDSELN